MSTDIIEGDYEEVEDINVPKLELIEQSWSEVDDIYLSIATSIVDVGVNVNTVVGTLRANQGNANDPDLVTTVNGLSRDLKQFTDELVQINSRHNDRVGVISNEDELALSISVFSDYSVLSDRFRSVIFPPMLTLTEYLAETAIALNNTLPVEEQVDLSHIEEQEPTEPTEDK